MCFVDFERRSVIVGLLWLMLMLISICMSSVCLFVSCILCVLIVDCYVDVGFEFLILICVLMLMLILMVILMLICISICIVNT